MFPYKFFKKTPNSNKPASNREINKNPKQTKKNPPHKLPEDTQGER